MVRGVEAGAPRSPAASLRGSPEAGAAEAPASARERASAGVALLAGGVEPPQAVRASTAARHRRFMACKSIIPRRMSRSSRAGARAKIPAFGPATGDRLRYTVAHAHD